MLVLNGTINKEIAFRETYSILVAKRLKLAKWCIPTKWKMKVSVVVQRCMSVGIDDIRGFVEAQFYFLSTDFCSKVFNLRYPPITVFMGENARHRFRKHVMKEESFEKRIKTNDDLLLFINSEGTKHKMDLVHWNKNKVILGIISGSLSLYTIAHYEIKNRISRQFALDCWETAMQTIPDSKIDDYEKAYNNVTQIHWR